MKIKDIIELNLGNLLPMDIAIIANGEFPTNDYLVKLIKDSKEIIACDGALVKALKHDIYPKWVVGDGDSLLEVKIIQSLMHDGSITFFIDKDQETNDLTKAVNFIKNRYFLEGKIVIFAATGLREDHTLANIALLEQYTKTLPNIYMVSDYGIFLTCHPGATEIAVFPKQTVSFFSFNQDNIVTCQELKWPLSNYKFQSLNSGTLNQTTSSKLTIITKHVLIVYLSFTINHQA